MAILLGKPHHAQVFSAVCRYIETISQDYNLFPCEPIYKNKYIEHFGFSLVKSALYRTRNPVKIPVFAMLTNETSTDYVTRFCFHVIKALEFFIGL